VSFVAGVWGRVYIAGRGNVAGIKSWGLDASTAEIPIPHFESTVDAYNRIWPEFLKGLSGATGSLEGYFDVGTVPATAVTDVMLSNGFDATMKLYLFRTTQWGFAVTTWVTNFRPQTAVENQPVTFSANFRVNGVVPLSSVV
jgi:hypothetical protein